MDLDKLMSYRKISKLPEYQKEKLKQEKQELLDSLRGADGIDGRDGKNGEKGYKGDKGDRGLRGQTGATGKSGVQGVQGVAGQDGENGKDGRGIEKTWIKKDDLWIRYTDGQEFNLGRVVGRDGRNGGTTAFISDTNLNIRTTSVTESLQVRHRDYIRQTVGGITTTLTCNIIGSKFYIKNVSGDVTTISATLDDCTSINLTDNEALTLVYNGTGFDVV